MKNKTKQLTKSTKNRITALILALLLTATILIPQIHVKAEGTTTESSDISENNGSGGTSAGAGDNLPIDTGGKPTITTNEDGTRTLSFHQRLYFVNDDGSFSQSYDYSFVATGKGKFTIVSYHNGLGDDDPVKLGSYLLSSSPFSINVTYNMKNGSYSAPTQTYTVSLESYKGVYYCSLASITSGISNKNCILTGIINLRQTSYTKFDDALKADIDNGYFDLSKDDYKDADETSAVYNKNLDFASISADYKVKYTIEKNKEGHFEFITPDEAGIQFDWSNRTDIDGAYVKFNLYGEYYDSFWSTTYTNTYVTLTCDRKNDLTYLCKQKNMIAQAKEKCNGSKGYGFVVNYIYVQAFANIDGTLCRSRIYKFDSDLVSDYGNADSEDDEWVPEITGGDSMPEDYEPDPENPDPEKTEPEPDKDDDTVVDTPIKYDPDVVINDDVTYLEAFTQFINVMKQGISYLGDFPLLVSKVFSYIPSIFLLFIGVGFAVALLLRFLGR